jgi:hypothetical protein
METYLANAACIAGRDRVLDDILAWYSQYGGRLWGSVVARSDNLSIDPKYAGGGVREGTRSACCFVQHLVGGTCSWRTSSHLQLLLHVLREAQACT